MHAKRETTLTIYSAQTIGMTGIFRQQKVRVMTVVQRNVTDSIFSQIFYSHCAKTTTGGLLVTDHTLLADASYLTLKG